MSICSCCFDSNTHTPICNLTHLNQYGLVDLFSNHEWSVSLNLGGFINGTFIWTPEDFTGFGAGVKVLVSPNLLGVHRDEFGTTCQLIGNIDGVLQSLSDNSTTSHVCCSDGSSHFAVGGHSWGLCDGSTNDVIITYSLNITSFSFSISCNMNQTTGLGLGLNGFTFVAEYHYCNTSFFSPLEAFTGCTAFTCSVGPQITDGITMYLSDSILTPNGSNVGVFAAPYCPGTFDFDFPYCRGTPVSLVRGNPSVEKILTDLTNLPTSIELRQLS